MTYTPRPVPRVACRPPHPLDNKLFRLLWWATFVSNMGTGMHEVTTGWLMAQLAPTPLMVSLVHSASTLPFFALALPAGALADRVNRRYYLLATQAWMMMSAGLMAWLTLSGRMGPWCLLVCTYLLAIGGALNSPAWHALTPEIVEAELLPASVTYNTAAINAAKALGPVLGGLLLVWLGPAAVFAANALSFLTVLWVLGCWKGPPVRAQAAAEPFLSAMRVGVQYVRHSPYFLTVIVRSSLFVFITNALWALLPLLCQQEFALSGQGYGLAMGLFGLGAVGGAMLLLPRLRTAYCTNHIVVGAWVAFVPVLLAVGWTGQLWLPMLWGGACWSCILSCCHLAAQSLAPAWVRARAMSVYLFCFFGSASLGSLFWGYLATGLGLRSCLLVSAATLTVAALFTRSACLMTGESFALGTDPHWSQPSTADQVPLAHGPIMVTVEYQIDLQDAQDFRESMERVRRIRYRNGVLQWGLYVDLKDPRLYREIYVEENWAAHLRQHQRVTDYDAVISERAICFHRGDSAPQVTRLAYCDRSFPLEYGLASGQPPPARQAPAWFLN
ncbi:MFS transporter [bacterium]|nr:MFS transporter [bacterium]